MRVAAVVEAAWDPASIEVDPVSGEIDRSRAAPAPTPGSREAVEIGLGLGETHVFGLAGPEVEAMLRECLAMGAASAAAAPDAYALADALALESFDLVLVPHRSGDHGASPVAGLLAGLLDLPQATGVESLAVAAGEVTAVRRLDRAVREEVAVPLPAVIAVEPGIARPRSASPGALIATRSATVVWLPPAARAPRPAFLGHRPPRPAPPRMAAPADALPAEARIAAVVGAATDTRQRELVTGTADEVARRILELLEAAGYLG
jgi:electron transfer flavoprotein beta subunit